ncbi:MAG: hypothetical protein Q8R13_05310 [bacterium]|nr:hypothetical protein [bacterium]MDZ4295903.1 hypothetical protein [Patescibacteria group bacterium]
MAAQDQHQSQHPAPTSPGEPSDWYIRTMAGDLAQLRQNKNPQEAAVVPAQKTVPPQEPPQPTAAPPKPQELPRAASREHSASAGAPPATLPVAPQPSVKPPPPPLSTPPKPPVPSLAPRPAPAPAPRPPAAPTSALARPAVRITPPPPAQSTPAALRKRWQWLPPRTLLIATGSLGLLGLVVFTVLFDIGGIKTFFSAQPPSHVPEPTSIEGEIVRQSTSTPSPTPGLPVAADDIEVVSATPETIVETLNALAAKPRAPGMLAALHISGLSPESVLSALGIKLPTPSGQDSPERTVALYFWTQRLEQVPRVHATRLVAAIQYQSGDISGAAAEIETMLTTDARPRIWLNNSPGTQATPGFQDNTYSGISIRYLNFSLPDLSLDYALIPDKRLLLIATSQEAMYATLDRLSAGGK